MIAGVLFLTRRAITSALVLLAITACTFVIFFKIPANPAAFLVDLKTATPEQVAHARHELRTAGGRRRTTAPAALTPAERRVAERAAAGQSNRAIAEALFVTPKTVELHLRNGDRKLGAGNRTQAVARARELGVIS